MGDFLVHSRAMVSNVLFETSTIVEFSVYLVTLTILALHLAIICPDRPYMSFFTTSCLATSASLVYFAQEWDLSQESVVQPWYDPLATSVSLFALAYMLADLPPVLFIADIPMGDRVMFSLHHVTAAVTLVCSMYYDRYQRLVLFFLTAELTNILLNGRKIIPQEGLIKVILDAAFAVAFLSYRMCHLFPILVRTLFTLAMDGEWFDLFVINQGELFIGFLHIYWTYLILQGVKEAIFPPKKTDQKEKVE